MQLAALSKVVSEEQEAEKFLRKKGILKEFGSCPYCGSKQFWRVRRNFYKCSQCKREWSIRKGSVVEGLKIPLHKFVLALKLFEMELPALRASKELGLAYNTVHKLFQRIREKIYQHTSKDDPLEGEVLADKSSFEDRKKEGKQGRGTAHKIPVFGILEWKGKVKVDVVPDLRAETLLREPLRKIKQGSLIYTDRFQNYDGLVMYGLRPKRINYGKHPADDDERVYLDKIEGFWSYAKERLQKFHGLSPQTFPYYLKELEFRYNHRNEDLFENLLDLLKTEEAE